LRFASGILVLTHKQLLAKEPSSEDWQAWALQPGLELQHYDHAGVGTLELHDARTRLGIWRHTLRNNASVLALMAAFERLRSQLPEPMDTTAMPLPQSGTTPSPQATSSWALLRL